MTPSETLCATCDQDVEPRLTSTWAELSWWVDTLDVVEAWRSQRDDAGVADAPGVVARRARADATRRRSDVPTALRPPCLTAPSPRRPPPGVPR